MFQKFTNAINSYKQSIEERITMQKVLSLEKPDKVVMGDKNEHGKREHK